MTRGRTAGPPSPSPGPAASCGSGRWTLRERLERVAAGARDRSPDAPVAAPLRRGRSPPPASTRVASPPPPSIGMRAPCRRSTRLGAAHPANLWVAGRLAGIRLAAGARPPRPGWFAAARPEPDLPDRTLPGEWLQQPWDLVSAGPARLAADLAATAGGDEREPPTGCWHLGAEPIRIGADARVEPGCALRCARGVRSNSVPAPRCAPGRASPGHFTQAPDSPSPRRLHLPLRRWAARRRARRDRWRHHAWPREQGPRRLPRARVCGPVGQPRRDDDEQ